MGHAIENTAKFCPNPEDVATKSDNALLRSAATHALKQFGDEGTKAINRLLKRDDSAVRMACLRILVGAIAADALVFPDEVIAAQVRSVLAPLGRPKVTRIIPAASSRSSAA